MLNMEGHGDIQKGIKCRKGACMPNTEDIDDIPNTHCRKDLVISSLSPDNHNPSLVYGTRAASAVWLHHPLSNKKKNKTLPYCR